MTEVAPDWIINVPSTDAIHDEPPPAYGWEGISDTALQGLRKNLIQAIVGLIGQLPEVAINLIRQLISMIDGAEDLIFEIINMVLGWITQAPELIVTVIETVLAWLIEIPELMISIVNAVIGIITDLPQVIVAIIDALLEWITSIPDLIITVINTWLSWITDSDDLIITVVESGLQWLIDVPEMVTSIVEAFLTFITSIPDVTNAIIDSFDSWVDSIPGFITDLVGAFLGWIRDVPNLLAGVVERIIEWFTDDDEGLVATIVTAALGWITEIPDLISLLISTWITWITEAPGAALDFITRALLPFGIFDSIPIITMIEQLLTGTFDEEDFASSFPASFPSSFGTGTIPPFARFIQSFLKIFNIVDWLSPNFNPLQAVTDIINLIFKPANLLAWLDPITGLLPDFQAPQILQDVILAIENAFNSIPFVGLFTKPVFDAINGLLGIGRANTTQITAIQNTINSANVPGGVSVSDSFDYSAAAATLPTASYNITNLGVGAGTWGPDGLGACVFKNGGGSAITQIRNRHTTPLATSYQSVSCVLLQGFTPNYGAFAKIDIRLQARMNAAETSWVEAWIQYDYFQQPFVHMRYVVGGVSQALGTWQGGMPNDPGTLWELRVGDTNDTKSMRVYRNSLLVASISAPSSVKDDVNNLFAAHTITTGQDNFGVQLPPPDMGIFAFSDRAPSS